MLYQLEDDHALCVLYKAVRCKTDGKKAPGEAFKPGRFQFQSRSGYWSPGLVSQQLLQAGRTLFALLHVQKRSINTENNKKQSYAVIIQSH